MYLQKQLIRYKGWGDLLCESRCQAGGKDNITCNCIAPGTVLTAMTETLGSADASLNVPLHRLGNVRDIANAALFLASNESDFITGATIDVNGGMGMR